MNTIKTTLLATFLLTAKFSFSLPLAPKCSNIVPNVFKSIYTEEFGLEVSYDIMDIVGDIYDEKTPIENSIGCDSFEKVASVLKAVQKKFQNYLIYPKSPTLNMVNTYNNAYNFSDHLHLPKKLLIAGLDKHPKHNVAVWAHEYGHSIFNHLMRKVSADWNDYSRLVSGYKDSLHAINNKHNPLLRSCHQKYNEMIKSGMPSKEAKKALSKDCVETIMALREKEIMLEQKANKLLAPYGALSFAAGGYNEFFADVIAVALLDDGAVIHDALYRSGLNYHKSAQKSLGRDFTTRKNDLDALKITPVTYIERESHNILSAVRRHVWKYYLSNPIYKKNIGETVQKIFKATAKQVLELTSALISSEKVQKLLLNPLEDTEDEQTGKITKGLSPEERKDLKTLVIKINERLIEEIDKQFEK